MNFQYSLIVQEMKAFAEDLKAFAAPESLRLLPLMSSSLESAQASRSPGAEFFWRFGGRDEREFFRTRASTDHIEDDNLSVAFGFWFHCAQGPLVRKSVDTFAIQAGSVAFLLLGSAGVCQHRFSVDFQAIGGPGSQFHVQCKGNFQNTGRFTELPRLMVPTTFPTEAISLVFHEVFPETWAEAQARSRRAAIHGPRQRERINNLLRQWLAAISDSTDPVAMMRQLRTT